MVKHLARSGATWQTLLASSTLAVLLVPQHGFPAGQTPTFSARTEMVRVDVMVRAGGQPVRGLQADDFLVVDSGVPQTVDLVSLEQIPLNIVLALDISNSVAGERLAHLRAAGHAVLHGMRGGDQVALLSFNDGVRLDAPLAADTQPLQRALEWSFAGGDTSLVDATYAAMMIGESDVRRALVIVFSDGVDTSSWLRPEAVLDVAKRSDVVVYGVSVRGVPGSPFLTSVADQTGGRRFEVDSTRDLSTAFAEVLEEFRSRYVIGYTPRGVADGGWHPITVQVKGRRVTVRARPGYLSGGAE
jgi:Ca-activated chloride channel homolog